MSPSRQLIIWSVPSIAVLLGIFWIRRRRVLSKSDPGGKSTLKSLQEELAEVLKAEVEAQSRNSIHIEKIVAKTAPIDIVPTVSGSQRPSSQELTDEEVELEIEKLIQTKSLKNSQNSFKPQIHAQLQNRSVSNDLNRLSRSNSPTKIANMANKPEVIQARSQNETINTKQFAELKNCSESSKVEVENERRTTSTSDQTDNKLEIDHIHVETSNSNDIDENKENSDANRRSFERDSANHSPVDPMLASPSMCPFSDSQSEGSSDSGKGCSEAASPPPAQSGARLYQFVIPQTLVGLLIGRQGTFVGQVKNKTGASIYVKRNPESNKTKVCAIEGSQIEIDNALDMIRKKFPEKKFPNLSLQEISNEWLQRLFPITPEIMALSLVEVVNNETIMTCLVSAGHFFLQQPFHPTFPALHVLHRAMAQHYHSPGAPSLPTPIAEGSICAAPTENNWYRAQVISSSADDNTSVVKLVDFGGYLTVENDQLKQIHADFMQVPFQATEAMLAYVKPSKGEWNEEAMRIMAGLTAGQLLLAQVAGYDEDGVCQVALYLTLPQQEVVFLNEELVERGLAEWTVPSEA